MLVVGTLRHGFSETQERGQIDGYHFASYRDVTAELLARVAPDIVVSALFCPDFDALDLARKLEQFGFTGPYRAVTEPLPDPAAVIREVRATSPGVDFDLFQIPPTGLN